ncbi:MAG TPA: DUF885 family protein [Steroidobacteraceae bacterium]|nr:DUF885 family protein [Steroidobacteraceae bacterium]
MTYRLTLLFATLLFTLGGCSKHEDPATQALAATAQASKDAAATSALHTALDHLTTAMLREDPEEATSLAVSEELAGGKYSNRLSDDSPEGMARKAQVLRDARTELANIDPTSLTPEDAITRDVIVTYIDNVTAGEKFGYGTYGFSPPTPYVVTQLTGAYTYIPDFLDTQHQVKTTQDAEDYVARVEAYAKVMDEETAQLKTQAEKGVVPPDFSIDGALKQLKAFAAKQPADTVLVQALARKAKEAKLDAAAQKDLVTRAERIVKEQVLPAYQRQIAELKALRGRAPHDAGVWRLPDGANYYLVGLRNYNTTALSPDEIHEMGLKLIDELHQQMDAILESQGMTSGSVGERMDKLAKDPKQLYPNTDAGRKELLAALNQQVADLQPLLPNYFGVLAKAKLEIRRVPPYIEVGAPGGYYMTGALDGSRPGAYYINLRDTKEWPKFSLPTLTYHEGEPGHHWQGSIALESKLPLIRGGILDFSGYAEGWGLYAEQLADEMGLYKNDPFGQLGYLQSMVFRATRLVVDTGMHYKKWSREKAIDFMVDATGDQRSSVTTEIERYAVWPGQATAYMVGRQTINRLRDEAKAQLGDKFDIRAFHDVLLTNGPVPLSLLDTIVKSWVAKQKGPG